MTMFKSNNLRSLIYLILKFSHTCLWQLYIIINIHLITIYCFTYIYLPFWGAHAKGMSVSCTSTSGKYTEMGCVNVSIMVMVMVTRMEMRVRLVKGSKTCFIEHNSKHPSPIEEYCCSSMPLMKVQQQKL